MSEHDLTQFARDLLTERDDAVLAFREERDAAMAAFLCPECGSIDGMAAIMRESIDPDSSDYTRLYRYVAHGDACHDLYAPCWQCNPGKNPARGYEVVTLAWVRAWLARPCQCNDCRRAGGEPYWRQRWSDDGHPLNELELVVPAGWQSEAA